MTQGRPRRSDPVGGAADFALLTPNCGSNVAAPARRPVHPWPGYNRCHTHARKTAISIPDRIFRSAEQLAARLGVSRSELYSKALSALLDKHRDDLVASHLNEVYGADPGSSALDPQLAALQHRSLARNDR